MFKKEIADKYTSNPEDRQVLVQVLDKLNRTQQRNIMTSTHFLNEHQRAVAGQMLKDFGNPAHVFYGGYEGHREPCSFFFLIIWERRI